MDRPILFSAPMVRAILDGRKTQTRRIVQPGASQREWLTSGLLASMRNPAMVSGGAAFEHPLGGPGTVIRCPYGAVGDRLWVRETWAPHPDDHQDPPEWVVFRADRGWWGCGDTSTRTTRRLGVLDDSYRELRWRPSIHMPRAASRITLEITGIRAERLQDISEEDARAEGVDCDPQIEEAVPGCGARLEFQALWGMINGARAPWSSNPWVWVVSFRRVEVSRG